VDKLIRKCLNELEIFGVAKGCWYFAIKTRDIGEEYQWFSFLSCLLFPQVFRRTSLPADV